MCSCSFGCKNSNVHAFVTRLLIGYSHKFATVYPV